MSLFLTLKSKSDTLMLMFQADDNSDDDDGESLDELIELLRASSESHVDDVEVWNEFRKEISQRRQDYRAGEDMRKVCVVV